MLGRPASGGADMSDAVTESKTQGKIVFKTPFVT